MAETTSKAVRECPRCHTKAEGGDESWCYCQDPAVRMRPVRADPTLCKGCGELEIDPRTYSGADGWCSEVCRVLAEQFQYRREDRAALREQLHSIEFVSRLGGLS